LWGRSVSFGISEENWGVISEKISPEPIEQGSDEPPSKVGVPATARGAHHEAPLVSGVSLDLALSGKAPGASVSKLDPTGEVVQAHKSIAGRQIGDPIGHSIGVWSIGNVDNG
jgi:hypothetical protein